MRTVAVALCIGLVTGALFSESLLAQGVERSLRVGIDRLGADVLVVPKGMDMDVQNSLLTGNPISIYMKGDKCQEVADIPGVDRASPQLFLASLSQAACCSGSFQLIAFDPKTDFAVTAWMKEALNRPLGKDEIVVGRLVFQQPGQEMMFYGHRFMVVGKLSPTGTGMDRAVFMSFEDAYVMAEESKLYAEKPLVLEPNVISAVMVKVKAGVSLDTVAGEVRKSVKDVSVLTGTRFVEVAENHLSGIMRSLLLVTGSFLAISALLVGTVFWMAVNERRREIGLLRAIGATKSFVFKMIIVEALLLTFLGGVLGVVGGGVAMYSFSLLISKSLNIPYLSPTFTQIVRMTGISLAIAVLTGLVASFVPALVSSRMEPLKAIRVGE